MGAPFVCENQCFTLQHFAIPAWWALEFLYNIYRDSFCLLSFTFQTAPQWWWQIKRQNLAAIKPRRQHKELALVLSAEKKCMRNPPVLSFFLFHSSTLPWWSCYGKLKRKLTPRWLHFIADYTLCHHLLHLLSSQSKWTVLKWLLTQQGPNTKVGGVRF